MTKQALAALPEFKRLQKAFEDVAAALLIVKSVHKLQPEDMGLFIRPASLYAMVLEHAADVMTQREVLAKLDRRERMVVRMV